VRSDPLDGGSRYKDTCRRVVECAGPRYGTRLSGYMAPTTLGGKYLFPSSGPQVADPQDL
jgi:hypothetical protein